MVLSNDIHTIMMLVDSAFPSGGFHYSGGTEALIKFGMKLFLFFIQTGINALTSMGPFVCAAYALTARFKDSDLEKFGDSIYYLNHTAKASMHTNSNSTLVPALTLAENTMRTITESCIDKELYRVITWLEKYRLELRAGVSQEEDGFHPSYKLVHPIIWGIVGATLRWDMATTLQTYMISTTRARVTSAVREGTFLTVMPSIQMISRIFDKDGHMQTIMKNLVDSFDGATEALSEDETLPFNFVQMTRDMVYTSYMVPEVIASMHDDLHSRLFRS